MLYCTEVCKFLLFLIYGISTKKEKEKEEEEEERKRQR